MKEPDPQRVALVTGGAVRVGAVISHGLAAAGFDLVVGYHASEGPALEMAERVRATGRGCVLVRGDLAEPDTCEALVETARKAYGRLDLLVNSASSFEARALTDVDADAWDAVMAVNVRAPHLVVRAAADLLRAARGSVVNIVDLSALEPWPTRPDHSVSKAALAHLTRVQALALAPEVRVNAVAPGAVMIPVGWSEDRWRSLGAVTPLRRPGSATDVLDAVLYLASAPYVTGQVLAIDGGRSVGRSGSTEE